MTGRSEYLVVLWQTAIGQAAVIYGPGDSSKLAASLDNMPRAHRSKDGLGIIGLHGKTCFSAAVNTAAKWEGR
jgi:hypothetical protein